MQTNGRSKQRSGTPQGKSALDATGTGTPNLGTKLVALLKQNAAVVVGSEEQRIK